MFSAINHDQSYVFSRLEKQKLDSYSYLTLEQKESSGRTKVGFISMEDELRDGLSGAAGKRVFFLL